MPAVLDKPRIQCRYHDASNRQCPLDALEKEDFCKFHLQK